MKNSLYIKDMVSINHAYISPYGGILGNSVTLNLYISGFASKDTVAVKAKVDESLDEYANGFWIIEGFSEATVTINGVGYKIRARDYFPKALEDVLPTVSETDIVGIVTNGFHLSLPFSKINFVETDEMWGMNTTFSFYEQLILKSINNFLKSALETLPNAGIVSVNTEVVETDMPLYENSLYESVPAPYVIVDASTGSLKLSGYMGYIATTRRNSAVIMSTLVSDAIFFTNGSQVGNKITASDGTFIEWFEDDFTEKTNLMLNIFPMVDTELDTIARYFSAPYLTDYEPIIWMQGRNNGVKVSL